VIDEAVERWRLLLGEPGQTGLDDPELSPDVAAADAALSWLYDREAELADRDVRGQPGGAGASTLTVPDWINEVHRLFPRETIERLERDAVERFHIEEMVTSPEVVRRVQPSVPLLQAVLRTKHLMNPEVLALARDLARRVVEQLLAALRMEVERTARGGPDRRRSSRLRTGGALDARRTIRENLRRFSPSEKRLYIEHAYFATRARERRLRWQLILLVDQSASMAGSVIHAAVTAAALWGMPSLKTHLGLFDTEVVDLTESITDPLEVLMKVQLGGGTDIARALTWAQGQIENPRQAIVALVSDFAEGGSPEPMVRRVRALVEQGTVVLGLAALDPQAAPSYDREAAGRLADAGARIGAMTPGELARFVAEAVRG
jgi:hypothetical protein